VVTTALSRWFGRVLPVVLPVAAGRLVFGAWPTAVVVAAVVMWWGLRAWAGVEARARRRGAAVAIRATDPLRSSRVAAVHVAFARALTAVADAYLTECEREANQP